MIRTEVYKLPVNVFYHLTLIVVSMTMLAMIKTNDVRLDKHSSLCARPMFVHLLFPS